MSEEKVITEAPVPVVETPVVEEVIPATPEPVAPVVPVVPVVEEKRFEFQPMDEQGRPLGGKQVIKYATDQELAEKLRDQNISLVRKLREVTRKQRLGINDDEPFPENTDMFQGLAEFKPRDLTPEERFRLSQDLNDAEKFPEARDTLIESVVGMRPSEFAKVLNKQSEQLVMLTIKSNYDTFEKTNTDFYPCSENKETLTDWMWKKGLAPTVANFKLAQTRLQEAGLLLEAPIVREETPVVEPTPEKVEETPEAITEPNPQVPVVPDTRISTQEQPQAKRPMIKVPSGLNTRVASNSGSASEGVSLTLVDIEKMSGDEYRNKLRDPQFRTLVDRLENEKAARRKSQV